MNEAAATEGNVTLTLMDQHIAANFGNKPAFEYNEKRYSYNDTVALMNRAGNMLRTLGVRAGDRVLIALPSSPAMVATLLGAMKIGAVAVVWSDPSSFDPISFARQQERPVVAVVHEQYLEQLHDPLTLAGATIITVGKSAEGPESFMELMRGSSSSLMAARLNAGSPALLLCSPGGDSRVISHGEIAEALQGDSPILEQWNLLRALKAFYKGETASMNG